MPQKVVNDHWNKKSASKTTIIIVASFYPLNSIWLQYSGLKYCLTCEEQFGKDFSASKVTSVNDITFVLFYLLEVSDCYILAENLLFVSCTYSLQSTRVPFQTSIKQSPHTMCRLLEMHNWLENSLHTIHLPKSCQNGITKSFKVWFPPPPPVSTLKHQNKNCTKIDLTVYRLDYEKYLSLKILYFSYKWYSPHHS